MLCALLLLPNILSAQNAKSNSQIPSEFNDKKFPIEQIKNCTKERYPNSDSVLTYDYEKYKYEEDGTSTKWDNCYETILTEKGKRENSVLPFQFSLPYSTVNIELVELIKKDGACVVIDIKKNSREMINNTQMAQNIYNPNNKILQVTIPDLEVGDTIHYIWKKNTVKPRVPNTWSEYFTLEGPEPINYYRIDIDAPKTLPLKNIKLRDEIFGKIHFEKKDSDKRIKYRWTITDVPRMFPEPNMPKIYTVTQRLLVSTIPNWEFISNWYWELCKPHIDKKTKEMKEKVAELISDKKTDKEKIKAIFTFVSQEVRYMGITTETEAPGYEPHDINITFENKYGVCRDKAALLVGMLQIAGFKAYPVIINNGPKKDIAVPQPYFNHAICCVESSDGSYTLMDPTDENTKRIFPAYLCNKSYLVAKPKGETLLTSDIIPAKRNMMKITTTGTLLNKKLTAKTVFNFGGINDNAYRGYFARLKNQERRDFFETHLKKLFPGAELTALTISPKDLMDTTKSLRVTAHYCVPDYTIDTKKYTLIPPVWIGTSFGLVNFILGKTGLQKRKYALQTDIACGVEETFKISVDNNYSLEATPKFSTINTQQIYWNQTLDFKKNNLIGESKFIIKAVEFAPKEYLALKAALKDIEYNKRKQQIFNKPNIKTNVTSTKPNSDVEIVLENIDIKLNDQHSWETTKTVKQKVLTYNGKKDVSELTFNYNPIWEKVELLKAQVTTNGITKNVSKDELNIMDAEWVGSAPRYPAGKTMVANLPNVEVGSTIEYIVRHTYKNKPFFSVGEFFKTDMPIIKKRLTLTKPIGLNLDIAYLHAENIFEKEPLVKGKTIKYSWNCENQPQIAPERYQPPAWSSQPTLLISSGNWDFYSEKLRNEINKRVTNQPKTVTKTKELTKTLTTTDEKIKAVRDFVAKTIRTDGPRFTEIPLSLLSNADTTLKAGYGNKADQAILIKAMLQSISIDSHVLLASEIDNIGAIYKPIINTPQRSIFNTMLVSVKSGNNIYILNDTDQYAKLGTSSHENKMVIDLENGDLYAINLDTKMQDKVKVKYTIDIDQNGNATIKKSKLLWGENYASFKQKFSEMNTERKKMYSQELISSISQAAILKSDVKSNYNSYPARESFEVYVPRFAIIDNKFGYLKLPVSFINGIIPQLSDTRKTPYYRASDVDITAEYVVNLPDNIKSVEHVPESLEWNSPNNTGKITITSSIDKNSITVKYSFKLKSAIFTHDDIKEIREISKQLIHKSMKLILYRS